MIPRPHPLRLFNSLTRTISPFSPLDPATVRLYSCGPTVYHSAHIGNLRAYVFVDTLRRVLAWQGYSVLHVINITDVGHLTSDADEGDDKMETGAAREKLTVWQIAEKYTTLFQNDLAALNVWKPSLWAKATDHIQEMIAFTQKLQTNGSTYELADGVYFDTSTVADYGKLARLDLAGQEAGKRVAGPSAKRHPSDFAVWRFSPPDKQRLMEWQAPWGMGAPGWHLECSVMALKYLGERFDIHTGGVDHRQVHHVNEIAQNQAHSGHNHPGAEWWLHNEFLTLRLGDEAEKMSKSSGHFLTLQSLVDRGIHPMVYRLFLLTASYRSNLEFSWDALEAAGVNLRRLLVRIARLKEAAGPSPVGRLVEEAHYQSGAGLGWLRTALSAGLSPAALSYVDNLDRALASDLHTPEVLVVLGELTQDTALAADDAVRLVGLFDLALGLGLLSLSPNDLALKPLSAKITEADIVALLAERTAARAARDFAKSDVIRDRLLTAGVAIKDGPSGTTWMWANG